MWIALTLATSDSFSLTFLYTFEADSALIWFVFIVRINPLSGAVVVKTPPTYIEHYFSENLRWAALFFRLLFVYHIFGGK